MGTSENAMRWGVIGGDEGADGIDTTTFQNEGRASWVRWLNSIEGNGNYEE